MNSRYRNTQVTDVSSAVLLHSIFQFDVKPVEDLENGGCEIGLVKNG